MRRKIDACFFVKKINPKYNQKTIGLRRQIQAPKERGK